jgi:hypothetical protein
MIIVINFTTTFVLTVKSLRPTEIRWNSCCYRLVKMPLQWVTHFATRFDLPLISIECRLKGNVFIFHYGACVFISSERLLQIIAPFFYRNVLESYLDQTDRWIRRKKYLPVRGAVNFPVCKFMAPPTFFNRSISNGMEVFVWFVRSCIWRLNHFGSRKIAHFLLCHSTNCRWPR